MRFPHVRPSTRASTAAGFTLVEVMVVVAMIGILGAGAVVLVKPGEHSVTARGHAHEIAALCDSMRQRAVSSRTYQRLEVQEDQVIHWQATTTGMETPTEWALIGTMRMPAQVAISAVSDRTHIATDDDVPGAGEGLPAEIDFAPDGAAQSATIFLTDVNDRNHARIAIYKATGSAYAYNEW